MQRSLPLPTFLNSRAYYVNLIVAFAGVMADFALTIYGLSLGFVETRQYYWLHGIGLGALISIVYFLMYPVNRKVAMIAGFVIAVIIPSLAVASNTMVLLTGDSPLLQFTNIAK